MESQGNQNAQSRQVIMKHPPVHIVNTNRTMFNILHCMYTNADQFSNKITELELRVEKHMPHVIGVTEVKPKNSRYNMNEAEFSLEDVGNYKMY